MKHQDVDSSLIHSIAYDEETRVLEVQFQDSGTYRYHDVEPQVVEELLNAESRGRYFNDHIRDAYLFTKRW